MVVSYEREADVPGQNTKEMDTGLLTRLWYPPTFLFCTYTLQASRQIGISARLSKTAELVDSAEPSGAMF
ncbi:hypothetical protein L390_04838 [Klebsiella quasipneumoniae subsp. similipneumoniae]|nr:hypothetical protein L390_04838 [Klebsiella quasipneumoniae subsp. similipneumoniae]